MATRSTVGLWVMSLIVAAGISACSGSDDSASDQPAADQLTSAEGLFASFQVTSPNLQERVRPRTRFPRENTCLGENLSPPLDWTEAPESTQSFALVAEDVDHDTGIWVHWVLYNIPANATGLPGSIPTSTDVLLDGTVQGTNDFRALGYYGPCPAPALIEYWKVGTDPPTSVHLQALCPGRQSRPGSRRHEG